MSKNKYDSYIDENLKNQLIHNLSKEEYEELKAIINNRKNTNWKYYRPANNGRYGNIPINKPISLFDEFGETGYNRTGSKTFTIVGIYLNDGKIMKQTYDFLNPGPIDFRQYEIKGKKSSSGELKVVTNAINLSNGSLYNATLYKNDELLKSKRSGSEIYQKIFENSSLLVHNDNPNLKNYYFDGHTSMSEDRGKEIITKISNGDVYEISMVDSKYEPLMQMADIPIHHYGKMIENDDFSIYKEIPQMKGSVFFDSRWNYLWNKNKKPGNCGVQGQSPTLHSITPDEKKSDSEYIKSSQKRGMKEHKKERDHDGSDTKFRKSRIFKNKKKSGNCTVTTQCPSLYSITPDEKKSDRMYKKSSQKRGMKEHKKERDHDKLNTAPRRFKKLFGKR